MRVFFFSLPTCALTIRVFVLLRRSSVILPIVGVDADVSLVLFITVGAPNCLEKKHIEVRVFLHLFKLGDLKFGLTVSESTNLTVLTLVEFIRESGAKLSLVLLRVVEFLHPIVTANAVISLFTYSTVVSLCGLTHFRNVAI